MKIKQILQKLKKQEQLSKFQYATTQGLVSQAIRKFIQDNNLIVHGSRALNKQTHFPYQRATRDYDVFTKKNPKLMAKKLEKLLDKLRGGKYHYVKPAITKEAVALVMDVGADLKRGTKDDFNLADFSKLPRKKFRTIERNDLTFADLEELEKAKLRTLRFKKFKFRQKKDRADLEIIQKLRGGFFWI